MYPALRNTHCTSMSFVASSTAARYTSGAPLRLAATLRISTSGCAAFSSATAFGSRASPYATTTTPNPCPASACASDNPIPLDPPVTSAQRASYRSFNDWRRCVNKVSAQGTSSVAKGKSAQPGMESRRCTTCSSIA